MRQLIYSNFLFTKRALKKISFIVLILLLPILSFLLKNSIEDSEISINVGIVVNDNSDTVKRIEANLFKNYQSIHFYKCNTINELKDKVANQTYECGYVFTEDFTKKLNDQKLDGIVTLYKSPGTTVNALSNEYIFSEIYSEYAFQELAHYIQKHNVSKIQDDTEFYNTLRTNYENYLNSDDVFSFKYTDFDGKKLDNTSLLKSYLVLSVRGLVALFIMLAAFIGTLNLYHDNKVGIFYAFPNRIRPFAKMSEIFCVSFLVGISGFISMFLCNLTNNIFKDIVRILIYCLISSLYCFILYKIIPTPFIFCAVIPLLVIGSIIFCPIFIDITEIIPITKYVSWLFLPRYYFIL